MPVLRSPRRERFAQEIAKGKPAYVAHKTAGFSGLRPDASKLQHDPNIIQRVEELQRRSSARAEIDKDRLTRMYLEDRALAYKLGQAGAARSATDSLAKLHGLLVNKVEVGNPGDFARMSDDELEAFIAERSHLVCGKVH